MIDSQSETLSYTLAAVAAFAQAVCVVVEEPGNYHETATRAANAGCSRPWIWEVQHADFVEALTSKGFADLHAAPCFCVAHEGVADQLSAWESTGHRSIRPCLPEHPWFSRGGSGFQVEAGATLAAQSAVAHPEIVDFLAPALACAGLLAILNRVMTTSRVTVEGELKAAGMGLLRPDGSLGLADDGLQGILRMMFAAATSQRWTECLKEALTSLGVVISTICSIGLSHTRWSSICSLRCDDPENNDIKFCERVNGESRSTSSLTDSLPLGHLSWSQWAASELSEADQRSNRMLESGDIDRMRLAKLVDIAVVSAQREGKVNGVHSKRESDGHASGHAGITSALELCSKPDAGIRSPWHLQLGDANGAVAHVLSASTVIGTAALRNDRGVFLELLLYVDGGRKGKTECIATFSVGACRTLSRFPLLAWRCEFSTGGHQNMVRTSAAAVSHFGSEVVMRCPLPSAAVRALSSWRGRHNGAVMNVLLTAINEPAWSARTPLPLCVQHSKPVIPWRWHAPGNMGGTWNLVGCSAPMWLTKRVHGDLVHQWLSYHRVVGFDKFIVYDLDGSLADALEPFITDGFVIYVDHWPRRLSGACSDLHHAESFGGEEPAWAKYCTQTQAEAHCVWSLRGRARWVMLLHSFDAYASSSNGLRDGMKPVLSRLEPRRASIAALGVLRFDFGGASTGDGVVPSRFLWRQRHPPLLCGADRGAFDPLRNEPHDHPGTVLVNPVNIWSLLTHWARGRPGSVHLTLHPNELRMNHYVDVLGKPRCSTTVVSGGDPPCNVFDNSSAWVAPHMARKSKSRAHTPASQVESIDDPQISPVSSSQKSVLVVVFGHGNPERTKTLTASLRQLREDHRSSQDEMSCLIYVYNLSTEFLTSPELQAVQHESGCTVVLHPSAEFLDLLSDAALAQKVRTSRSEFVLLLLEDIASRSEYGHPMLLQDMIDIMIQNKLDVASPALVGTHRTSDGMLPVQPRGVAANWRIVTSIAWKAPLLTTEAFWVLSEMVNAKLSKTLEYNERFTASFLAKFGRLPLMGTIDVMPMRDVGSSIKFYEPS